MLAKIKVLPEDLINKIAAGEVIERPASVAKELVENAIDAGAERIVIEINNGGRDMIRVTDDGRGMGEADLKLSIERHATSKISSLDELFSINTLGFRGEALPSIASVSRLNIQSRVKGQEKGYEISYQGPVSSGQKTAIKEVGMPEGTTVTVRDLFYNTPARLKFLKSTTTEVGHISEIVAKFILAYPKISLRLLHNAAEVLFSPGNGKLLEAAAAVYGHKLVQDLVLLDLVKGNLRVSGLVGKPTLTRINRDYENIFVNGRYIKNIMLSRAAEHAYHALIPHDRHPFALIFLQLPPAEVDQNVHPTKREVKFLKLNEVMSAVREAVSSVMANAATMTQQSGGVKQSHPSLVEIASSHRVENTELLAMTKDWSPQMEKIVAERAGVRAVAQVALTYIIAVDGPDLLLIDQHAAHERMIFESLAVEKHSQQLLIPETLELTAAEKLKVSGQLGYLKEIGFDLADFGANSFLVRAVPASAGKVPPKEVLKDIVADLAEFSASSKIEDVHKRIRQVIACRAAIKAGDKLEYQEMQKLIDDLFKTPNFSTCPHGRPSVTRITERELAKMFRRV